MNQLRILATNDFLGAFAAPSSTLAVLPGAPPGGEALRRAAHDLRAGHASLWIDAGDWSQGGPIAAELGLPGVARAAADLGIDLAALGNHECDWGVGACGTMLTAPPFPILGANVGPELPLPGQAIIETSAGPIGCLALTTPDLATYAEGVGALTDETAFARLAAARAEMRCVGVRAVILVVHEGVDWEVPVPSKGPRAKPGSFAHWLGRFTEGVDLVIAGHSIGRWVGRLSGVPVLQPWVCGHEIGLADMDLATGYVNLSSCVPNIGQEWCGSHAEIIKTYSAVRVGYVDRSHAAIPGQDNSLGAFIASAVTAATSVEMSLLLSHISKAPVDGSYATLPAGPVSQADVARLLPWQDDSLGTITLSAAEITTLCTDLGTHAWTDAHLRLPSLRDRMITVAVPQYWGRRLSGTLARETDFCPLECGMRMLFQEHLGMNR